MSAETPTPKQATEKPYNAPKDQLDVPVGIEAQDAPEGTEKAPEANVLRDWGGRPRKFQSVEDLESKIEAFFDSLKGHWEDRIDYVARRGRKGEELIVAGKVVYDEIIRRVWVEAEPPTVSGLALELGTSRRNLLNYEERGMDDDATDLERKLFHTIKAAKIVIERWNEKKMASPSGNVAGLIFSMKNNFGYKDKIETENETKIDANVATTVEIVNYGDIKRLKQGDEDGTAPAGT